MTAGEQQSGSPAPDINDDVLGPGYTAQTLQLRPDHEGPVVATLVRRAPEQQSNRAVLFLHGFVDYFFHTHVADAFAAHGYDFYALDLRKYGRALRAHQTANYITDVADYDEEIDEAIRIIRAEGHDVVVAYGHSTGGLILPLWANRRRAQHPIDAMILNSPFFDLNGTAFERGPLTWLIDKIGRIAPRRVISALPSPYANALHLSNGGEWDFNTDWKSLGAFPVRAGWLRTVRRAHRTLNQGLQLDIPVLVAASARSGDATEPGPQLTNADCVLNVDHMVAGSKVITADPSLVTLLRVEDGLHDLTLSPAPVREKFLADVFDWAETHVPVRA